MKQSFHPDAQMIICIIVSVVNIFLAFGAVFLIERKVEAGGKSATRMKFGLVAMFFGLGSQVLYGLMLAAWTFDWGPFGPGNSFRRLAVTGCLLSSITLLFALFSKGFRRLVGLWVAVTTWYMWVIVSFEGWFPV